MRPGARRTPSPQPHQPQVIAASQAESASSILVTRSMMRPQVSGLGFCCVGGLLLRSAGASGPKDWARRGHERLEAAVRTRPGPVLTCALTRASGRFARCEPSARRSRRRRTPNACPEQAQVPCRSRHLTPESLVSERSVEEQPERFVAALPAYSPKARRARARARARIALVS